MCKKNKIRHLNNFLFLVVLLFIESFVLGIFMQIASAIEYQKHINVIDRTLYLFGVGLLGTLFKLIFEAWLIYSVSIFREIKKGITQTKIEILKARIISAKIFIVAAIFMLILAIFSFLFKGQYLQILGAIVYLVGISLPYIISIVVSYYFANKYISKYEKNT